MGHDKLRKFAENEGFSCLLQPSAADILADGYFAMRDQAVKGHWNETMFDEPRPIVLELGCGKGEYTIDLSRRIPSRNYIGVDIKGARLWKGAKYAHENKLGNVAFLRTRIEFLPALFAEGEVSEIWLTFSDPQLKSENARLTSPVFLERYRKFLRQGGVVHLKTDSRFLYEYSLAVTRCNGLRILAATSDLYGTPPEALFAEPSASPSCPTASSSSCPTASSSSCPTRSGIPSQTQALYEVQTFYERMFRAQGYKICYLSFVLDGTQPLAHPDFDAAYWRSVEGSRHFITPPSE